MNTFSWTIWSSDPAKTRRFVPEGCTVTMRLLDDTIVAGYRFHARDPQHARDVARKWAHSWDLHLADLGKQGCLLCCGTGRLDDLECPRCDGDGALHLEVAR